MKRVVAAAALAFVLALAGLAGCGDDGSSAGDGAGATRTVTHALGTSEVPAEPERVLAVTGTIELESLLALGVTPIAAAGDDDDLGARAGSGTSRTGSTASPVSPLDASPTSSSWRPSART